MNISKISRSIVVVIFLACIIFFSYLNISDIINKGGEVTNSVASSLIKVGFVFAVLLLVLIYMYIKDKLYKKHVKRKVSFIYRYVYIVLVLLVTSIISSYTMIDKFSDNITLFYMLASLATCFVIKKIIFNISKSDILSVLGMFTYSLLPNIIVETNMYILSTLLTLIFLSALLIAQILIDELKQKGLKTRKYMIQSILLGIFMGISSIFGVHVFIWIVLLIIMIGITYNLDNTHINFPKKMLATLTQEKREALYRVERININKLIVSILITVAVLLLTSFATNTIINKMSNNEVISSITQITGVDNVDKPLLNIKEIFNSIKETGRSFVSCSTGFYMFLFLYILFMEILAIVLRRRYDTKSTIMKAIFLITFLWISIFKLNVYYFQPLFTVLLILIAIVNTSNIYLNREERIKMLVA